MPGSIDPVPTGSMGGSGRFARSGIGGGAATVTFDVGVVGAGGDVGGVTFDGGVVGAGGDVGGGAATVTDDGGGVEAGGDVGGGAATVTDDGGVVTDDVGVVIDDVGVVIDDVGVVEAGGDVGGVPSRAAMYLPFRFALSAENNFQSLALISLISFRFSSYLMLHLRAAFFSADWRAWPLSARAAFISAFRVSWADSCLAR
jgi:hypothetical protein